MARTKQQQVAIDTVLDKSNSLIKIKAVAGAGKTFTLTELAKELNPKSGLYISYNKAIAEEATQKFKGTTIKCSTIHSLAYRAVVFPYGLKVGFFNPRDVIEVTYEDQTLGTECTAPLNTSERKEIVDTLEEFFLSDYTDVTYFMKGRLNDKLTQAAMHNLNLMANGSLTCSHSLYLKLYHIYLANGEVEAPSVDLLLIDECGDLTPLTIAIFKLIKAPKKVAVGDPMQNIYSFNNTVNAFEVLANEGVEVSLTNSFRVSDTIAPAIEQFVQEYADPSFKFGGRMYPPDTQIEDIAYISRNNSALVEKMFELMATDTTFHTTRRINTMLEYPLFLANVDADVYIKDHKYRHVERLRKQYEKSPELQSKYPKFLSYLERALHNDDEAVAAFKVVSKHGKEDLKDLEAYATKCTRKPSRTTLTTAHSSKG